MPPSLCSLKRNASCWEANRIKLVHKCKEALKKDKAKHFLDLHQAKCCVSVGVHQIKSGHDVNCSNTFFPASPGHADALFGLLSQHSLLPSHGPSGMLPGQHIPIFPLTPPGPISQAGFIPALHSQQAVPPPCSAARGGREGARLAPASTAAHRIQERQRRLQRRAHLPGLENSLGQVMGLEHGWPGQHLEAATCGAGLVQTNLSEE